MVVNAHRRDVRNTLIGVSLLVCIGGLLYAFLLSIPIRIGVPLVCAFTLEACLYIAACAEAVRKRIEPIRPPALALAMTVTGVAPYLIYSGAAGFFSLTSLGLLTVLAAVLSFWYVVLPRRAGTDVAFVAVVAAVLLSPIFPAVYGKLPKLPLAILGQLMWTRLALLEALSVGRMRVPGFGLIPTRKEWTAGVLHFALFLPVGVAVGWATGFAALHLRPVPWWQTVGVALATFLGMLLVVALREEFFVRGLLQTWLSGWLHSDMAGLIAASVLFGLLHLPFRGFPNWRFALLAAIAGLFYGRVYLVTRSVRAAMVSHALVNTMWRVFFS